VTTGEREHSGRREALAFIEAAPGDYLGTTTPPARRFRADKRQLIFNRCRMDK